MNTGIKGLFQTNELLTICCRYWSNKTQWPINYLERERTDSVRLQKSRNKPFPCEPSSHWTNIRWEKKVNVRTFKCVASVSQGYLLKPGHCWVLHTWTFRQCTHFFRVDRIVWIAGNDAYTSTRGHGLTSYTTGGILEVSPSS